MKKLVMILLLMSLTLMLGIALGRWWQPPQEMTVDGAAKKPREILYWKAPMDPNYRRDAPGKSPMGMDLVPVYADDSAQEEPGVVRINPAMVHNLGVRTAVVESGMLPRRIETVAYLDYNDNTRYQISTRVDGWIETLAVKAAGDAVTAGQVLFELYSPALVNAQEELLAALRTRNASLQKASRKRLAALGMTATEIRKLESRRTVRQRVPVTAKAAGVVTHLGAREGMYVGPATPVMTIASLDELWVLAEVFERQVGWVQPGQHAEVTLDYLPGQLRHAVVDYLYPQLDSRTRTLKVRLLIDNPDHALRPNMFARVTIHGAGKSSAAHIPREALIRGGRADRVVLVLGDGKYRSQVVTPGMESGDRIDIIAGLAAGDEIVTSGQFLIDSESSSRSALDRLTSGNVGSGHDAHGSGDSAAPMDHAGHAMPPPDTPSKAHATASAKAAGDKISPMRSGDSVEGGAMDASSHQHHAEDKEPPAMRSGDSVEGGTMDASSHQHHAEDKEPPAMRSGDSVEGGTMDASSHQHHAEDKEPPAMRSGDSVEGGTMDASSHQHHAEDKEPPAMRSGDSVEDGLMDGSSHQHHSTDKESPE